LVDVDVFISHSSYLWFVSVGTIPRTYGKLSIKKGKAIVWLTEKQFLKKNRKKNKEK
jgi:hypothetical protein